jgi:hypothetical protein
MAENKDAVMQTLESVTAAIDKAIDAYAPQAAKGFSLIQFI